MTDDEIKQLEALRLDKERICKESGRINDFQRSYSDNIMGTSDEDCSKWFNKLIHRFPTLKFKKSDDIIEVRDSSGYFSIDPSDYRNKVVQERIRLIQQKIFNLAETELDALYDDVSGALEDYKGEDMYPYIKTKLNQIEDKRGDSI